MNLRLPILLGALLLLAAAAPAQQRTAEDSTLAVLQQLYENGQYSACELEARRFLERTTISDSVRVLGEQYLAFSLVALGRNDLAIEHFQTILQLNSKYTLDPAMTSPKILSAFNEARYRYAARKERPEPRDTVVIQPAASAEPLVSWRVVVFPGVEQVHQGRPAAGTVFLVCGGAALASTIAFDLLRRDARDEYRAASLPDDIRKKYDTYNRYYHAEIYSAIALGAAYVVSQIDAFVNLPRSVSVTSSYRPESKTFSLGVSFSLR